MRGIMKHRNGTFKVAILILLLFQIWNTGCFDKVSKNIISNDDSKNDPPSFQISISTEENLVYLRKDNDINDWNKYSIIVNCNDTSYQLYLTDSNNITAYFMNPYLDLRYNVSYRFIIRDKITGDLFFEENTLYLVGLMRISSSQPNNPEKYN